MQVLEQEDQRGLQLRQHGREGGKGQLGIAVETEQVGELAAGRKRLGYGPGLESGLKAIEGVAFDHRSHQAFEDLPDQGQRRVGVEGEPTRLDQQAVGIGRQHRDRLLGQTALAVPGAPRKHDPLRQARFGGQQRGMQLAELLAPAHEGRTIGLGQGFEAWAFEFVGVDRLLAPLDEELARRLVVERMRGQAVGLAGDQDAARLGLRLQALGEVDGIAHDRVVALMVSPDGPGDHQAGVEADPDPESEAGLGLQALGEALGSALHGVGRADRPLGVVFVGDRCAEESHDGVTNVLVDDAPEAVDGLGKGLEAGVDDLGEALGVEGFAQAGEAGDVGEEDGDHPAIAAGKRAGGPAAAATEVGFPLVRVPAGGTACHGLPLLER